MNIIIISSSSISSSSSIVVVSVVLIFYCFTALYNGMFCSDIMAQLTRITLNSLKLTLHECY